MQISPLTKTSRIGHFSKIGANPGLQSSPFLPPGFPSQCTHTRLQPWQQRDHEINMIVLWIRTWGLKMVGADGSAELQAILKTTNSLRRCFPENGIVVVFRCGLILQTKLFSISHQLHLKLWQSTAESAERCGQCEWAFQEIQISSKKLFSLH